VVLLLLLLELLTKAVSCIIAALQALDRHHYVRPQCCCQLAFIQTKQPAGDATQVATQRCTTQWHTVAHSGVTQAH